MNIKKDYEDTSIQECRFVMYRLNLKFGPIHVEVSVLRIGSLLRHRSRGYTERSRERKRTNVSYM